jgi:hypothetical protein
MIGGAGAKLNPSYLEEYAVSFNKNEVMDLDIHGKNKDPTLDKLKAASKFGGDDVLFAKLKNDANFRLDFYADWENKTFQDWAKSAGYKALVGYDPSASQVVGVFQSLKDVPDSEYIRLLASTDPADHWWKNSTGTAKVLPLPKKAPRPKFYIIGDKTGIPIEAYSKTSDGMFVGDTLKNVPRDWIVTYETLVTKDDVLRLMGDGDTRLSMTPYVSLSLNSLYSFDKPSTFTINMIHTGEGIGTHKGLGPSAVYRLLENTLRSRFFAGLTVFETDSLSVQGARLYSRLMRNIALSYKRNPESLTRYPMLSNPAFKAPIMELSSHGVVFGKPHILIAGSAYPTGGYMKMTDFLDYIFKYGSPFADGINISTKSYFITAHWALSGTTEEFYKKGTGQFIIGTNEELSKYLHKAPNVFDSRIALLKAKVPEAPSWFFDTIEVNVNSKAGTVDELFQMVVNHPYYGKIMAVLKFFGNILPFIISPYVFDTIEARGGLIEHLKKYAEEQDERLNVTKWDNLSLEQLTLMVAAMRFYQDQLAVDTLEKVLDVPLFYLGMIMTWLAEELDKKLDVMHKKDELTKDWFFELFE